jgi:hypothetical protein
MRNNNLFVVWLMFYPILSKICEYIGFLMGRKPFEINSTPSFLAAVIHLAFYSFIAFCYMKKNKRQNLG